MRKTILSLMMALAAATAFAEPHAYPVPYVANRDAQITFTDLPYPGSIRIVSEAGDEVVKLDIDLGEDTKNWLVTNSQGKRVGSGVYIYLIEAGGEKSFGKLVVVR